MSIHVQYNTKIWCYSWYSRSLLTAISPAAYLPRDALECKARSCDRMSSVRPSVSLSVCDVGGL